MAQSAVSAIRTGCQWLAEGKAVIDDLKGETEGMVNTVKQSIETVTGLWDWAKNLFKFTKPKNKYTESAPVPTRPSAKASSVVSEVSYEQYQAKAVHDICENLKVYFEAIRALKAHCRELEQDSLTTEKVADSAIDRIELEWQMNQLAVQVREAMVYTPESLGLQALYRRFLEMYDQILEEQEFARDVKAKKDRDSKWQQELLQQHRIDKALTVAAVLLLVAWMWGLLLSLGWLVKTPGGLQSLWSS
jgi:hypothetical protein